ncbi:McrC family protein [Pantoea sp. A4]|uniref:McrC family protein n=1 Tax=Pantoea sp. A4 TaxID=1225184 RepID=UPI000365CAD7|nr:McrC family protein [Pantoea sp. A4]
MTHLTVHEWGSVSVGVNTPHAFTRTQANALLAVARSHPLANQHGTNILIDRHSRIFAKQMVGVIAATGCSIEILPKIDARTKEPDAELRHRLIRMLDVAFGLKLGHGQAATMARQSGNLLEILIRLFAERLLAEVHRGLPRAYLAQEDDLPALRGRLNIKRQFTALAVRPDSLACHYDELSADTALMRIMKACVVMLRQYARAADTIRCLNELRNLLVNISDIPVGRLQWSQVRIDRTNHRWEMLYDLARLLLKRDWQATHHDNQAQKGITLLFPMNDLFEAYIAALAKRAVRDTESIVRAQAGRLYCLIEDKKEGKPRFQTRPDLIIERDQKIIMIIDTKWKCIEPHSEDTKKGVSSADVYQMMAYAQIYQCPQVTLLYPHHSGLGAQCLDENYKILAGEEKLQVASIDLLQGEAVIVEQLVKIITGNMLK